MFSRFKIRSIGLRISIAFYLLILCLIILSVTIIGRMNSIETNTNDITRNWMPSIQEINRLNYTTEHILSLSYRYFDADASDRPAINEERTKFIRETAQAIAAYDKLSKSAKEAENWNSFKDKWKHTSKSIRKRFDSVTKDRRSLPRKLLSKERTHLIRCR